MLATVRMRDLGVLSGGSAVAGGLAFAAERRSWPSGPDGQVCWPVSRCGGAAKGGVCGGPWLGLPPGLPWGKFDGVAGVRLASAARVEHGLQRSAQFGSSGVA
jgi:hypothetical protein